MNNEEIMKEAGLHLNFSILFLLMALSDDGPLAAPGSICTLGRAEEFNHLKNSEKPSYSGTVVSLYH